MVIFIKDIGNRKYFELTFFKDISLKNWTCGIMEPDFALQSRYYVYFPIKTRWKAMNPLSPQCYGLNSRTSVLPKEWI